MNVMVNVDNVVVSIVMEMVDHDTKHELSKNREDRFKYILHS